MTTKFHRGSPQMFESHLVEALSHVHPATPAVIFVPIIAASLYAALYVHHASAPAAAWCVAGGYSMWTLTEYWLHRLVFHLRPRGPRTQRLYFIIHGVHHDWPWDTTRLVMPPAVSILLAAVFYATFRGAFGPQYGNALFAGFALGYLIYDTLHWYTHAHAPRLQPFKYLRKQHLIHHFRAPDTRFGVSCPWWDFVFGTSGR